MRLLASRTDFVSAHVLASAAAQVTAGVAKHQGKQAFGDLIADTIRPERLKEFRGYLSAHYNFAKHADRDPIAVSNPYKPEQTIFALFEAIANYGVAFGSQTIGMLTYKGWMAARYPDLHNEGIRAMLPRLAEYFEFPEGQGLEAALSTLAERLELVKAHEAQLVTGIISSAGIDPTKLEVDAH